MRRSASTAIYGQNDPLDAQLLRFLGISDEELLDIVRAIPDDRAAALQILSISGKTPEQCADSAGAFGERMGRFCYNTAVMTAAYAQFARKDASGPTAAAPP